MTTDTLLRDADPLVAHDDLDPHGPMASRIRREATRQRDRPLNTRFMKGSVPLVRRRLALAGLAAVVLAVALVVALPGGRGAPPDARAALVDAAQRTAEFDSGHLVWHMVYQQPALDLTNDVRYDGADFDNRWTTRFLDSGKTSDGGVRIVGGRIYDRFDNRPWVDHRTADKPEQTGVKARVQAADALADAARAASDVRAENLGDGAARYTATVSATDVPNVFRGPGTRKAKTVSIVAVTANGATLRSLQLRSPGEMVDITFDGFGQPQHIVAP